MMHGQKNIKLKPGMSRNLLYVSYIFTMYSQTLSIQAVQVLGPTQPPIQRGTGYFPGGKEAEGWS